MKPVTQDGPLGGWGTLTPEAAELDLMLTQWLHLIQEAADDATSCDDAEAIDAEAHKLKREIVERYTPRPEEQRKNAERYLWLREERDEQQPVVTIAKFSDWGQPWRDVPLWGDELDAAVDKAMLDSPLPQSRSET